MKKQIFPFLATVLSLNVAFAQVTLTESRLPIVIITTPNAQAIPDEPKITADMRIIWNGAGKTNKLSDTTNHYKGKIGVELRGSTSQTISDKKPYAVELRDAAGNEIEAPLLGMPKHEDWALLAPYSDKSLIREALMYQWGGEMMAWAARTRFCEVIVNGNYRGVYVLCERIKRDKDRVNITKRDSTILTGDALTGGYIVKIDKTTGNPTGVPTTWVSNFTNSIGKKTTFQYEYPRPEDIKSEQRNYIRTAVNEMEIVMNSANFADTVNGYAKFWNVNSLVDFFILNELSRNVDGYRLSSFFYKDRNSVSTKFVMGPIWDFNIALGNADYCAGANTSGWQYLFNSTCPSDGFSVPFWWEKLMSDPRFKKKISARWKQLRQKELALTRVNGMIDSMTTVIGDAATRNFQQWNILTRYVWPNPQINNTYTGEIAYLKTWLANRIAWLDGQFEIFTIDKPQILETASVYPNPSSAGFNFDFYTQSNTSANLLIFNNLGQIVFNKNYDLKTGLQQLKWQDKALANGTYFYRLLLDGQERMKGTLVKM